MQDFSQRRLPHFSRAVIAGVLLTSLVGCSLTRGPAHELAEDDVENFEKALRDPKTLDEAQGETLLDGQEQERPDEMTIVRPPTLSVEQASQKAEDAVLPGLTNKKVKRQAFDNMPVPAFINEIYGNQLSLDFVMQPSIRNAPDLVSMRLNSKLSEKDLYAIATKTLNQYGVTTFLQDGVLVFDYSSEAAGEDTPILASGRALPEVPSGNRPVFHIYPLASVNTPQVRGLLTQMFPKSTLEVSEDIARNALILKGKLPRVREAIEAIRVLDRPAMAGMQSAILQPAISTADELANNLQQILDTEGFIVKQGAGNAPVRLLPLGTTGQLVVFAKSEEVLDYIVEWAEKLEKQRQTAVENGLFSYQVQSTQAKHIVTLLNQLGIAQNGAAGPTSSNDGNNNNASQPQAASSGGSSRGRYAVDEQLNTILYSGSGKDWLQALSMIKRLDKPAPSVMIEVILAEVSLDEEEQSAIEWLAKSAVDTYNLTAGTIGNLGYDGSGLNLQLTSGDSTRAQLNFLYNNSRSTIRSRPRIMVKSGQQASIDVGDRVPIITSNTQSTQGNSNVIQQIQYTDTGVLLDIKPTVHATGFVDIEIRQELSEAVERDVSTVPSPTISNRTLETTLTLRDGGSVLIGGLIRTSDSEGERGVPGLAGIPLVGKLFRGDTSAQLRTELVVMVIPYILNGPDEVESLSDELQQKRMRVIMGTDGEENSDEE
ncbi:secretin N-terminal domain-containing protein [Alteromonas halophila]|uniref:Type II secretion system protein n=1 Tax=Alteromonas halophila TaxID=516698 RepID=A0A918N057_9ALTE|nr:secretin N-terminal domain-containing protein [Alteromonas halophila]GGW92427.1 type II secretion system protein [Alteromonas halophila]